MSATKVMAIIAIILSVFAFLCMAAWSNPYDYESAIGWGVIADFYMLAFGIVACATNK